MRLMSTLIVLPLLLVGIAGAAEMFRWVDADGKVHYTDTPPPPTAKNVQQKKLGDKPGSAQLPYALQQAMKNSPVTLYNSECGDPCVKAKALLVKRGIPFTEKNPEKTPADAEALKKITGGPLLVPVLVVGADIQKWFEESSWNGALDQAGYPKEPLLPKLPTPPSPPAGKSAPAAATTPPPSQPQPQPNQ